MYLEERKDEKQTSKQRYTATKSRFKAHKLLSGSNSDKKPLRSFLT